MRHMPYDGRHPPSSPMPSKSLIAKIIILSWLSEVSNPSRYTLKASGSAVWYFICLLVPVQSAVGGVRHILHRNHDHPLDHVSPGNSRFARTTPPAHGIQRPARLPARSGTVRYLARPVSILIGIFLALLFSSQWMTFALFLNKGGGDTFLDPILGKPLSFYFFTLPVLDVVGGWIMTLAVIVMIPAVLLSVADGAGKFRGISIALSLLLAAIAFQTFLERYALLLEDHNLFSGINYVGDKIVAPGLHSPPPRC